MTIKSILKKLVVSSTLTFFSAAPAFSADSFKSFKGIIEGADCVINKQVCAKDAKDPLLAMEREFVLVTADGQYYFLPNLTRFYKASAYKKIVRVKGKQNGAAIVVENFEVLKNDRFAQVWNQTAEWESRYGD